jgi:hypothetical protein
MKKRYIIRHIPTDKIYAEDEGGSWCKPEVYLEEEDAKKVREAINVIKQYEQQGYDEGYFEEM